MIVVSSVVMRRSIGTIIQFILVFYYVLYMRQPTLYGYRLCFRAAILKTKKKKNSVSGRSKYIFLLGAIGKTIFIHYLFNFH